MKRISVEYVASTKKENIIDEHVSCKTVYCGQRRPEGAKDIKKDWRMQMLKGYDPLRKPKCCYYMLN